jgi:hypothetical protein
MVYQHILAHLKYCINDKTNIISSPKNFQTGEISGFLGGENEDSVSPKYW